jgi:hypothetical protein
MKTKTYTPTLLTLPRPPSRLLHRTPARVASTPRARPQARFYAPAKPTVTWHHAWAVAPLIP